MLHQLIYNIRRVLERIRRIDVIRRHLQELFPGITQHFTGRIIDLAKIPQNPVFVDDMKIDGITGIVEN